jgi:hypothetical protein
MAAFKTIAAQGELGFIRMPDNTVIPEEAVRVEPVNGYVIVGHSETGHHHVMTAERTELYQLPDDLLACLMVVKDHDELTHLRDFDTHESLRFDPGTYKVRKLREYTPEGFRRQAD